MKSIGVVLLVLLRLGKFRCADGRIRATFAASIDECSANSIIEDAEAPPFAAIGSCESVLN